MAHDPAIPLYSNGPKVAAFASCIAYNTTTQLFVLGSYQLFTHVSLVLTISHTPLRQTAKVSEFPFLFPAS